VRQLAGRNRDASAFPADISLSAIDTDEGLLITGEGAAFHLTINAEEIT
jgi:hypothetical protein